MQDYLFKTKPYDHQLHAFTRSRDMEYFALLMEQGTGKSKVTIDTACWLWMNDKIDAVMIIAPNGVHQNWIINEFPAHTPDYVDYKGAWWGSQLKVPEKKNLAALYAYSGMRVVAVNVESLQTEKGVKFIKDFLIGFRTMLVLDESTDIKNPSAMRTKNLLKISIHSKYRRILTGTPVTQSPLDIFTQYNFLDSEILQTSSYYGFKNRYAIQKERRFSDRTFMEVVGYIRLDELVSLIEPYSYRITKAECLDLPEKLYTKRYVELSPTQKTLYQTLKKELIVELNGQVMSTPLALTKLLRLQQIVGGFFVPDADINDTIDLEDDNAENINIIPNQGMISITPQPIDKVNPRIESLVNLLENTCGKAIIWARFRPEISSICTRLREKFGEESVVEYRGGVDRDVKIKNIEAFQNNDKVKYFVATRAGAKGLTLTTATTVIYYSNTYSLEDRLQSEDRAHRIGQKNNVTYIDFIAKDTMDEKIVETLRAKKELADIITGDQSLIEWL